METRPNGLGKTDWILLLTGACGRFRVTQMFKLTPWFDGKVHVPLRNGWYDCKECNARHYFLDGLWYRNKKSLKDGPMLINEMHWRGLVRPALKS